MDRKQITYIELTPEEFNAVLRRQRNEIVNELSEKIGSLTSALSHQAPSLTREQAAAYCGRSLAWIDARRKEDRLPSRKVGGHPRFLRAHLDHLLCGGEFNPEGKPLKNPTHDKQRHSSYPGERGQRQDNRLQARRKV